MFKNGFFYVMVVVFALGGLGCSSSNDSGEDLDISEIQEIEATGEFNEDEFFITEGESGLAEEELVEEVPGLEDELGEEVAKLEEGTDLALNEGAELFDDLDLDETEEVVDTNISGNVNITADELDLDSDVDSAFDSDVADTDVVDGELDLDMEEDLFRDDAEVSLDNSSTEEFVAQEPQSPEVEDVTIDVDYSDQIASNTEVGSTLSADEVTIDDIDYAAQVQKASFSNERGLIPVKKMKTVPYSKNGVLVNAVYFVRQGDTLRNIADKVYGSGSGVDFRIVNPHLTEGNLRVGQKVYYNSPVRSQDRSRLLTFYEDVRMPAQTYNAQVDENIRTVSKELLGHSRSWMEIWASNQQIQSKGNLDQATQIRYWNGQVPTSAPVLAKTKPVTPPPAEPAAVDNQASLDLGDQVAKVEEAVVNEEPEMALEEEPVVEKVEETVAAAEDEFELEEEVFEETEDLAANEEIFEEDPMDAALEEEGVAVQASAEGRDIARNNGNGFAAKTAGGLGADTTRLGILGLALLLLLAVGFLVVKRRRDSQNAVEMDSFDFGGETSADEGQTKTQIDL